MAQPENLKAVPLNLNSLIQYASQSVVSKTLIDKKVGTLTLFSFDAGQGLSEHTAPYDAVAQIIDGQAQVTIGGKDLVVSVGEMVIMPANIPHALKALNPFKMLLTMIRA